MVEGGGLLHHKAGEEGAEDAEEDAREEAGAGYGGVAGVDGFGEEGEKVED